MKKKTVGNADHRSSADLSDPYVVWFYKREREKKFLIFTVIAIVALVVIAKFFIYHVENSDKILLSMPDTFCICSGDGAEYDLQFIDIEDHKKTYHIEASKKCLETPDSYVYATGSYWNYPFKPTIHVDGEDVKVGRTVSGSLIGGYYHFYIKNVVQDQKYRIYIRCGKVNDYINVVFHGY